MEPLKPTEFSHRFAFEIDRLADESSTADATPSKSTLEQELPGGREAHDPYVALRTPRFPLYMAAFFLSGIGGQIQFVALAWELYHKTGSPLDLGWMGLITAIPMLLLSLPAGHWADRHSRRNLFLFLQISRMLGAAGLMVVSWRFSGTSHAVAGMYALLGFSAIGATVGRPGREALMAHLVPNAIYPNAVMWNAMATQLSSMIGPAIGGIVLALSGPAVAYIVAAASFGIGAVLVLFLPDSRPVKRPHSAGFADVIAGLRFVFRTRLLFSVLALDLFAVLFGGATFLLPLYAAQILHVGAFGFGCLRAAPSIGAMGMALTQAHMAPFKRAGRTLLLSVAAFGLATIVFGLSKSYLLSFAMLVVTGMADNISVVIRRSLIPLITPDRMRGRVMAVNQIFTGSSNELGGLESGMAAYFLGPVLSVVLGGAASIAVVIAIALGYSEVRQLTSLQEVEPSETEAEAVCPTLAA